jgi:hypothetical protein
MQSVDGLSGVFEMRPPEASPENAVPEFEIVSKPAASDESARPEDVHAQAAAAGHVEPRPEFVVDRVSISIPLKEPERLPEAQAPSAPEPPTSVGFPQPAEQMASSAGLPSFVAPEEDSPATGYTGIYEFEPPRGSLESPAIETRLGDIRASDMAEFVEPSEALAQPSAAEMEVGSAVAVETAEPAADEIVSAVPLPVWVAEEVALDQCELNVSLEEEMRAALASSLSAQHVEVPLDLAAERLAAFTTEEEPVEMQSGAVTSEIQPVEFATAETRMGPATENLASERFETMSDDIMAESTSDRSWQVIPDSSANMPETGAMDALASLQGPVSDFSSEATVAPHFGIPGPSFDAVPASEFSLPMDTGIVIDAETIAPESAAGDFAAPQVESEIYSAPEAQFQPESMPSESPSAGSNPSPDNPPHAFGAMAQAIVDSPALSSLKGADAEPVVEAIVTRMLEQIKPELVAHVLRELEKK